MVRMSDMSEQGDYLQQTLGRDLGYFVKAISEAKEVS